MSEKRKIEKTSRGPGGMIQGGEKANNFKDTMKNLIRYMNEYKVSVVVVVIFAAVSASFSIIGPKMLGNATTKLFEGIMNKLSGSGTGVDFNYIGK